MNYYYTRVRVDVFCWYNGYLVWNIGIGVRHCLYRIGLSLLRLGTLPTRLFVICIQMWYPVDIRFSLYLRLFMSVYKLEFLDGLV